MAIKQQTLILKINILFFANATVNFLPEKCFLPGELKRGEI